MPIMMDCRLLCAATCAYDILADGVFNPQPPHYPAVNWATQPAVSIGGNPSINACLLGSNADGVILAFRGTLPPTNLNIPPQLRDWLNDFDAQPIVLPPSAGFPQGVMVHEGFWNALETLWPQITPALRALIEKNPEAKLYVTGHSKGAAMAALAAARLSFQEKISAAGVYLYAPPRAGNSAFVSSFPAQIRVVRYEHYLDVVPFVPPNLDHLKIIAQVPGLDEIFKDVSRWDYTPLGTLRYIRQDGTVVGDSAGLSLIREEEIISHALEGGALDIARAHAPWCQGTLSDGGYMLGICPQGVCS